MDSNPWQSQSSQGNSHSDNHNSSSYQQTSSGYQPPQRQQQQIPTYQSYNQPQTQPSWQTPSLLDDDPTQNPTDNPWESHPSTTTTTNRPTHQYEQQSSYNSQSYDPPPGPPPTLPLRRNDTDTLLLDSEPDRAEQVEHMQQYEASKPQSEDDRNQAALQKQFPSIDSSLIAAIYHDHKLASGRVDLAEVREMLQELAV